MPDGQPWPRVSIVTPSYNQGQFIEETIRSVLLQGYPNLEYIIIDGNSTDNSVEIIQKYAPWLTYWVSEPDRGQSHAINKGLARATGAIFNWLNSDDQLKPGALAELARVWSNTHAHLIAGGGVTIDSASNSVVKEWHPNPPRRPTDFVMHNRVILSQPSTFLSMELVKDVRGLREDLNYVLDWEFYLRCMLYLRGQFRTSTTSALLSTAQSHPEAKTSKAWSSFSQEWVGILKEHRTSFSLIEWPWVVTRIRQIYLHEQINAILADSNPHAENLMSIAFKYPEAIFSRSYWGTARRLASRAWTQI